MIGPIRSREVFGRFGRDALRRRAGPLTVVSAGLRQGEAPPAEAGIGYAISRRVGGAVQRNRLRRRLRELCREIDQEQGIPPGWYLVVAHPGAAERGYRELKAHLSEAFRSASAGPDRSGRRAVDTGPGDSESQKP